MIDIYNREQFVNHYNKSKFDGKTDEEISNEIYVTRQWLTVLKEFHEVETIVVRRNNLGVTEDDFRKGALLGLDRRIILRRVRDGMLVKNAINTPRRVTGGRKKK